MADTTALVTDGARPTHICGCAKLAAAGWSVKCNACGARPVVSPLRDDERCAGLTASEPAGRAA